MGLGLGEGGVVAAGAADQRAAGAAAARRQQVAAAFAVEVGRAGEAADQPVGAGAAVEVVGAGARTRSGRPRGRRGSCRCRGRRRRGRSSTAASEPSTRRLSLPGPRSAISQRAGPSAGQIDLLRVAAGGPPAAGADRDRPWRAVTPKLVRFGVVEGDGEVVGAGAADDLQPAAAAGSRVEADVGGALRRRFRARRRRRALGRPGSGRCPGRRSARRARRRRRIVSLPGPPSITFAAVADQRVVEGRAFDALEAEEPVVAVAAGLVLGERDPDAACRLPAADVGREGGDVAACRGRRPCGRSRSRRGPGRSCRGRR